MPYTTRSDWMNNPDQNKKEQYKAGSDERAGLILFFLMNAVFIYLPDIR